MSLICTMSDCPTCPIAGTKSYCPEGAGKESEYVKIVLCRDCKFYHGDNGFDYMCDKRRFVKTDDTCMPDDYCSYGDRRTE